MKDFCGDELAQIGESVRKYKSASRSTIVLSWLTKMRLPRPHIVVCGVLLCLYFSPTTVNGQGPVFACCGANASVTYGSCGGIRSPEAVADAQGLIDCWAKAVSHFRNNTLDPELGNVTIASQYPFFTIMLSARNPVIEAPPNSPTLQLNSDDVGSLVEPVEYPDMGLRIIFSFPADESTGECKALDLRNWQFNFQLDANRNAARTLSSKDDTVWGMGTYFSGCGRDVSLLSNVSLTTLGYGQPSFSFVTLRHNSSVVSSEASQDVPLTGLVSCLNLFSNMPAADSLYGLWTGAPLAKL